MDFPITKIENVEGSNIKTFTSLAQLGLDNTATLEQICLALPNYSVLKFNVIKNTHTGISMPENLDGQLIVNRNGGDSNISLEYNINSGGYIKRYVNGFANWASPKFSGWKTVATNGALSMPSSNAIKFSLSESGETYTAPADGYIYVQGASLVTTDSENARITIRTIDDAYGVVSLLRGSSSLFMEVTLPVRKGRTVIFHLNKANITISKFVYAQSEV